MGNQLNRRNNHPVIPIALHVEMEQSYLAYAMSVIIGRALPDARDGLKPVHRRILYAMHELGLTPDRPFRKCARVVGDVLGKYHPHGDQAVYDALVRMVQPFASRFPLLDGHGNFGSVDGDPPAAMRYTETRLSPLTQGAILNEISDATVDFIGNFDNSQQEPVVLPVQLPVLLLNGCSGIAVGMATNIPPHNLSEIVDGLIALIDRPDLSDEKLWRLIPGPDFPTGGEIVDATGIYTAYQTGRGSIPVRGVTSIETLNVGKRRRKLRQAIVVTELPYQVNKSSWIEKVADLVNQGKLVNIADIRDESDRSGMRVVIELKRDGDPEIILARLYKQTALQSNFGVILLAIVNHQPRQLSLRQCLETFLEFREQTLRRQYRHDLDQAQQRIHLVAGLLTALNQLDLVIEVLRHAPDGTTAKGELQTQVGLSEAQADALLAMPMRRLTGLERQKLQGEYEELRQQISRFEQLLTERHELLKALKKSLRSLKRQFKNPRRTRLPKSRPIPKSLLSTKVSQSIAPLKRHPDAQLPSQSSPQLTTTVAPPSTLEAPTPTVTEPISSQITTSAQPDAIASPATTAAVNATKTQELPLFQSQARSPDAQLVLNHLGEIYWQASETKTFQTPTSNPSPRDSWPLFRATIGQQECFVVIANNGKAYPILLAAIPPQSQQPGIQLRSLLPTSACDPIQTSLHQFFYPDSDESQQLLLLSAQGRIKRLGLSELRSLPPRGISLIKLKTPDRLQYAQLARDEPEVAIATSGGRILRFALDHEQLPTVARQSQGVPALRLRSNEILVGCACGNEADSVILLSQLGYGKQLAIKELRLSNRGDIGTQALRFTQTSDQLVAMQRIGPHQQFLAGTSQNRWLPITTQQISSAGKEAVGDRLFELAPQETIIRLLPIYS